MLATPSATPDKCSQLSHLVVGILPVRIAALLGSLPIAPDDPHASLPAGFNVAQLRASTAMTAASVQVMGNKHDVLAATHPVSALRSRFRHAACRAGSCHAAVLSCWAGMKSCDA